ncbi:MAG: DUF4412 domain-containing protein [Chlorobiaceae bacterium]|nr:DUF4412 domain-containing protein [Chlorobiaceae bacterium]NTW62620.1 DUF4412 domain-containing protein [Chlorobiaceae bacterium]
MRKFNSLLVFAFSVLLTLGACGDKKQNPDATSSGISSPSLPFAQPFEGVLTMKTTIPEAGSTEMKLFFAKEGVRTETSSNIKGMASGMHMVMLSPSKTPNLLYLLNENEKTYTVIDTDEMKKAVEGMKDSEGKDDAIIENLGKETMNGYSCTHVRITRGKNVMEMWVSKDILDYFTYARMQSAKEKDMPKFAQRMKDAGVEGFPVKILQNQSGIVTELVNVDKQNLDASLFEVPPGYVKTESPMMNNAIPGKQSKEMESLMKKMQERMKKENQ